MERLLGPDRRHYEEIGGRDLLEVIRQEGAPGFATAAFRDRRLADPDPELQELAVDSGRTPQRLASDIERIRARTSRGTRGRPSRCRLFQAQKERNA
jgi:hypothetical protein